MHLENLSDTTNFLFQNNLPFPGTLNLMLSAPRNLNLLPIYNARNKMPLFLTKFHYYPKIKSALLNNDYFLLPSDKIDLFALYPASLLRKESLTHLNDLETYLAIPASRFRAIVRIQNNLILQAIKYFSDPSLLNPHPTPCSFFLLPKLHKPPQVWRTPFCEPKTRPIVSSAGSPTYFLAKKLLPYLQKLESLYPSIATSSLDIIYYFQEFHRTNKKNIIMATLDVESLFTKIPLNKLLYILSITLPKVSRSQAEANTIHHFLSSIIKYNVIYAFDKYYLQMQGLPMGGSLSGSLANLYLAYLEQAILAKYATSILLYKRYMDDIFIIYQGFDHHFQLVIDDLQSVFNLPLTSCISKTIVSFLDLKIHYHPSTDLFYLSLFSKNSLLIKIPPAADPRPMKQKASILKSSLIRIWRNNTCSTFFTLQIELIISQISVHPLCKAFNKVIIDFYKPLQIRHNLWEPNFTFCQTCRNLSVSTNIKIVRSLKLNDRTFLAASFPTTCDNSSIISIVCTPPDTRVFITANCSPHYLIGILPPFSILLPFKNYSSRKVSQLVKDFCLIPLPLRNSFVMDSCPLDLLPCHLHFITHNMEKCYGIPVARKATTPVTTYFNSYKKFSTLPWPFPKP
jgi:hypothetical protein